MRRVNLLHAHGSPTGYLYYQRGCRCVACGAAMTEYDRKYRAEHIEEHAEQHHKYYTEHREEMLEYRRNYDAEHREEVADCHRKYAAEHVDEIAEYKRKYRAEHIEEITERDRKYSAEHREEIRQSRLQREYGTSGSAWDELFANQGECCGCCGTADPGSKKGWATDHDHKTGAVRGILCNGCNAGLGHFRDDPERLMAGIEYLAAATL